MKGMLLKALGYFPFCFRCCLATLYCAFIKPQLYSVYSWRVGRSITNHASQELTSKIQDTESQYANSIINNDLYNRGWSAGKQVHTEAQWPLRYGGFQREVDLVQSIEGQIEGGGRASRVG